SSEIGCAILVEAAAPLRTGFLSRIIVLIPRNDHSHMALCRPDRRRLNLCYQLADYLVTARNQTNVVTKQAIVGKISPGQSMNIAAVRCVRVADDLIEGVILGYDHKYIVVPRKLVGERRAAPSRFITGNSFAVSPFFSLQNSGES